jgi:hypothetical protein
MLIAVLLTACSRPAAPSAPGGILVATTESTETAADGAVAMGQNRATLCHRQGNGTYTLLTISASAEPAHRAHGDGAVGEQLPRDPGMLFGAGCVLVPVTVGALVQVTAGSTGTFNFAGQSVTLPGGGPFNNLRFNWYAFSGDPVAFGTLYLLTAEYLGLPGDLSPATVGYVARSQSIVGHEYRFAPGVTVSGGAQYRFYTDTQGSFVTSFTGSTYPGGDMYVTGVPTLGFHKALAAPGVFLDANFRLQGAAVSAP